MPQQLKIFAQDDEHPTVEDVEAAANAWLAAQSGKIGIMGIGQNTAWNPDGRLCMTMVIVYFVEDKAPIDPNKPS